jgi:type VI secretion system protein ImpG
MRSDLLLYYENELSSLRKLTAEFAARYPKIASRLVLEPNKCEDPHVERLLEGFAFLAARVHLKLDDEFPLITESLLEVLYPDFLRPVPSMSIAQFDLDPDTGAVTTGFKVKRGSRLYSKPVNGVPCKFRTAYETTLFPITVTSAAWKGGNWLPPELKHPECAGAIRLELRGPAGVPLSKLDMDGLRLFLNGESSLVHTLYEMLNRDLLRIAVRAKGTAVLPPGSLRPIGFETDERLLDYSQRSFAGYRLLQEYFAFPDKFLFVELSGLRQALVSTSAEDTAEIYFLFSSTGREDHTERLEQGVDAKVFRPNCIPVVNLFEQTCEPILLDQRSYEYPIVPDVRRQTACEIYSIDEVVVAQPGSSSVKLCEPFYSPRMQGPDSFAGGQCFWTAYRRPSTRPQDSGTDISLALVDGAMRGLGSSNDTMTVRTTCTNRDLPSRLPFGNARGDFEMEGNAPVARIVALRKPTATLRPPGGPGSLWNLVSHLSLNYLSIVSEGKAALQTLLRLSDYTCKSSGHAQAEGITAIDSRPHFARLISEQGMAFVRGTSVELELDEEKYVGGGAYLFASVLERFFAQYCSLNSFSQLTARVKQRKEVLHAWQPRAGQRILM